MLLDHNCIIKQGVLYSRVSASVLLVFSVVTLSIEPAHLAAILPLALLRNSILTDVSANTVLFACFPLANVLSSISPDEGTLAFSLIVDEVTLILLAIFPCQYTVAIHFVLAPISSI